MRPTAFTAPGRFWRGNLHTHSNRSDGVLTPEEVCRRYRAEGYDFLALTDHFVGQYGYPIVDTTPFQTAGFTTLPGAELHSGAMANGELCGKSDGILLPSNNCNAFTSCAMRRVYKAC